MNNGNIMKSTEKLLIPYRTKKYKQLKVYSHDHKKVIKKQ